MKLSGLEEEEVPDVRVTRGKAKMVDHKYLPVGLISVEQKANSERAVHASRVGSGDFLRICELIF